MYIEFIIKVAVTYSGVSSNNWQMKAVVKRNLRIFESGSLLRKYMEESSFATGPKFSYQNLLQKTVGWLTCVKLKR